MKTKPIVVFAIVLCRFASTSFATTASFQGLGDLPGSIFTSEARGVSADGSTVVGYGSSASGTEAFRWTSGDGMVGLGDLPGGYFSSVAYGVSADGLVVVGEGYSASADEAFRWTSSDGMVGLGDLSGGGFSSSARGVSADGSVVVGYSISNSSSYEAFRWTSGDGMVGLGDLSGGQVYSRARDVSADGSVVAGWSVSASGHEAFRWTSDDGMIGLGDLPGGSFNSYTRSVSADGSTVVGSSMSASGREAFRWTSDDGMVGLGDLPGGDFYSSAQGVSADGSVVVGYSRVSFVARDEAFIWDTANGMQSLKDVLVNDHGLDLSGWTLHEALGISPDGLTIVGHGYNPSGYTEAWVATIPEPPTSTVVIELVTVGNAGNPADTTGYGAVGYNYSIGKYEVTAGQYTEFLNAVAATDTYRLYNRFMMDDTSYGCKIERIGSSGNYSYSVAADYANRPVNYVGWGDAVRFANWLYNGQPTGNQNLSTTEDGSYFLNGAMPPTEIMAITRQVDATWVTPSEDEWYKAAYHKNDGLTGNYFSYPTSSDNAPSNNLIDPDPGNNATFYDGGYTIGSPYWRTEIGDYENSESPYGTFDMGGNVWEWNESIVLGEYRGLRGGSFAGAVGAGPNGADTLLSWNRYYGYIGSGGYNTGFRVAFVPEQSTPPVADANGPYIIFVGDTLTLDANGSADADGDIVSYLWDLDDDSVFETDANDQAIFDVNYSYLESIGLLINHTYTIHLKVTDSESQSDVDDSTLTILPKPALQVAVDIKPGGCPNPVNTRSSGVLLIAILGTADVNVLDIDATSVRLAGVEPLRNSLEDVAGPVSDNDDCNCIEAGPDGFLDLTLKFATQAIVEAIGDVNDGDVLELELTGVLYDPPPFERPIEGADCILIKGKYKAHNKADINKDGVVDMADFTVFANNWLQSIDD